MKLTSNWIHLLWLLALWAFFTPQTRAEAPTFLMDLQDQTALFGQTVSFEVTVAGSEPLHYEWRSYLGNTYTVFPLITGNVFVLTNAQATLRKLAVVVSNSDGAITSRLAGLTVNRPASISSQPASTIVLQGTSLSLNANAVGSTPISYQWLLNGLPMSGRTTRTLNISSAARVHDGAYQVIVSNTYGASTSRVARIHVIPNPSSLGTDSFNGSSTTLPYRIFIPSQPTTSPLWPLVISLHGAGEVGNDNLRQLSIWPQSMVFVSLLHQEQFPCFFVAPQCPAGRSWSDPGLQNDLTEFIQSLITQHPIDPDRIYLTGLSMGGYGIWSLLATQPDLIAAAVPICGGGDPATVTSFRHVPLWNFHSQTDNTVPVSQSRGMIAALRRAGGNPIYTEYADGGHSIWPEAWATPDLVPWTMSQLRSKASVAPPQIHVQSPGPIPLPDRIYTITSNASPWSGTLQWGLAENTAVVAWTNFTARTGGIAGNETAWQIPATALTTNQIQDWALWAITTSWAPSLSGNTTFYEPFRIVYQPPIQLELRLLSPKTLQLHWTGTSVPVQIQTKTDWTGEAWTPWRDEALSPLDIPANDGRRYFRIVTP